jgi:hypothetical protein
LQAGYENLESQRPMTVIIAASLFLLLGAVSVVYGLDDVFAQSIKGGWVGVVFSIIDFVVAWLILRMRRIGGALGFVWAFLAIFAEFVLPLIYKNFAESDGTDVVVLYSVAILVLLEAYPHLK